MAKKSAEPDVIDPSQNPPEVPSNGTKRADPAALKTAAGTATAPVEPQVHPGVEWMNTAPVEEIIKHPRFGGILGQRVQEERERTRKEIETEQAKKAREDVEREMEELANYDPREFSQRWLSAREQERIKDQEKTLRDGIRKEFATQIGETFRTIAEWQELTPDEFSRLQQAVAGKDDDSAVGAFNIAALEIISDRKSTKRLEEWRAKDLAKEREAIRAEEAAKVLSKSQRPDLARGSQPGPFDPSKLSDKEFDDWYRKTALGRI